MRATVSLVSFFGTLRVTSLFPPTSGFESAHLRISQHFRAGDFRHLKGPRVLKDPNIFVHTSFPQATYVKPRRV